MDSLCQFLEHVRRNETTAPNFLGLLHVLIGRRITAGNGTLISSGLSWRETAALLKKARWDKNAVRELGLDPKRLPGRDRARFWYAAISHAGVDSSAARQAGDRLADQVRRAGFVIQRSAAS